MLTAATPYPYLAAETDYRREQVQRAWTADPAWRRVGNGRQGSVRAGRGAHRVAAAR